MSRRIWALWKFFCCSEQWHNLEAVILCLVLMVYPFTCCYCFRFLVAIFLNFLVMFFHLTMIAAIFSIINYPCSLTMQVLLPLLLDRFAVFTVSTFYLPYIVMCSCWHEYWGETVSVRMVWQAENGTQLWNAYCWFKNPPKIYVWGWFCSKCVCKTDQFFNGLVLAGLKFQWRPWRVWWYYYFFVLFFVDGICWHCLIIRFGIHIL